MQILIKPHLAYWGSGFSWRGEITVVLAPHAAEQAKLSPEEIDERLAELRATGLRKRDIARQLAAQSGWSARDIYARMHERKG